MSVDRCVWVVVFAACWCLCVDFCLSCAVCRTLIVGWFCYLLGVVCVVCCLLFVVCGLLFCVCHVCCVVCCVLVVVC